MSWRWLLLLVVAVGLQGCARAAISDIGEDKVRVVGSFASLDQVNIEAQRGCGIYGRTPVLISQWCRSDNCIQKEYLFACKRAGADTVMAAPLPPPATLAEPLTTPSQGWKPMVIKEADPGKVPCRLMTGEVHSMLPGECYYRKGFVVMPR